MLPPRSLLFGCDAPVESMFLSPSVQGQLPHQGEMLRAFALPRAVVILPHGDIQDPVHAIFALPMRPHHAVEALGVVVRGPGEGTEIVAALHTLLVFQLPDGFHHHQTCESRPPLTRDDACQGFGTPHAARLDPPVATIHLYIIAKHHGLIEGRRRPEPREAIGPIAVQTGLMFLSAQPIVRALRLNLPRDCSLTSHRIKGHDRSGQIEPAEPRGQGGHLVGVGVDLELR